MFEEDKNKYKSELSKKEKEIKSLKAELVKVEKKKLDLQDDVNKSKIKIEEVERNLVIQNSRNTELCCEIKKMSIAVESYKENEKQSEAKANAISKNEICTQTEETPPCEETRRLRSEKSELAKQLKVTNNQNQTLMGDFEAEKKKYTDLFLSFRAVKEELAVLKENTNQVLEQDEVLQAAPPPLQEERSTAAVNVMSGDTIQELGNICYLEAMREGNCPRGAAKCRFSHNIRPEVRNNDYLLKKAATAKEERAAKCVNEFFRPGSCKKGKSACRFSHKISESHRQDPVLRRTMEEKFQWLTGRQVNALNPPPAENHQISTINESDAGNWQDQPGQTTSAGQYYVTPAQQYSTPQPLMAKQIMPPVQIQAMNLLQNLLAQMMNANQFNQSTISQNIYP